MFRGLGRNLRVGPCQKQHLRSAFHQKHLGDPGLIEHTLVLHFALIMSEINGDVRKACAAYFGESERMDMRHCTPIVFPIFSPGFFCGPVQRQPVINHHLHMAVDVITSLVLLVASPRSLPDDLMLEK